MLRLFAAFLAVVFFAVPLQAGNDYPVGEFRVINSTGFVEMDGIRQELETDRTVATARIARDPDDSVTVMINGSTIRLHPLKNGLASVEWNARGTAMLHKADIQALMNDRAPGEIPAWGAELVWPDLGPVQMVLLPFGFTAYTGFLVSHPGKKTVVREMEFQQVFGPTDRPRLSANSHVAEFE
ncbi:hypothetical protein [Roseibium marinum]|uniref:Uncharacterized protein n=1 Tax=Roseibium marinum TaxID=281252 RepID=A0A2S3UV98_9HYPH|nr:hypothetical protein [Roseibium marinum]POF31490.1 hypothetical protein CLV41_10452 [Roseibium marinum]